MLAASPDVAEAGGDEAPGSRQRSRPGPGRAAPQYRLVVDTAPSGARVGDRRTPPASYAIEARETLIGRDPVCAIRLDDVFVSRRHARLLLRDHELHLEDLESANGTRRNGDLVETRVQVRPGDILEFGPSLCRLESGEVKPGAEVEVSGTPDEVRAPVAAPVEETGAAASASEPGPAARDDPPDYEIVGPLPGEPRRTRLLALAWAGAVAAALVVVMLGLR